MYQHHEESLRIMKKYFMGKPGVLALVFGGSVAKGQERPDSDLDGMVIVTPEYYEEKRRKGSLCETISGMCTYEGGYFDIKYMTKDFLQAAAEKGSEPTRNSFLCAKVLFSSDPEIDGLVQRIPVFQEREYEDKMLSFYSSLMLNYNYFWKCCHLEGYMKLRVTAEIVYVVYRMILQENKILFPSNRRLEETVAKVPEKPDNIVELGRKLAESQGDQDCDAFVKQFLSWMSYQPPEDFNQVLSRYQADYETWWLKPRPLVNEW